MPGPLPRPALALTMLCLVLATPALWWVAGDPGPFYVLCVACACALINVTLAVSQVRQTRLPLHAATISIAGIAAIMPLITLVLFTTVFIIGRSSNVAQVAGDSGFDYWRLWFEFWPMLLFGNPISFLVAFIALVMPPYRPRFVAAWALPLSVLIACASAMHITAVYFPDA